MLEKKLNVCFQNSSNEHVLKTTSILDSQLCIQIIFLFITLSPKPQFTFNLSSAKTDLINHNMKKAMHSYNNHWKQEKITLYAKYKVIFQMDSSAS